MALGRAEGLKSSISKRIIREWLNALSKEKSGRDTSKLAEYEGVKLKVEVIIYNLQPFVRWQILQEFVACRREPRS